MSQPAIEHKVEAWPKLICSSQFDIFSLPLQEKNQASVWFQKQANILTKLHLTSNIVEVLSEFSSFLVVGVAVGRRWVGGSEVEKEIWEVAGVGEANVQCSYRVRNLV